MLLNLSAYSDGGRWLPSMHHRSHDQEGSTSRGGGLHPEGSAPGEGSLGRPLPQRYMGYYGIRSTSGRYASYWNASLLTTVFLLFNSHPLISALTMRMYWIGIRVGRCEVTIITFWFKPHVPGNDGRCRCDRFLLGRRPPRTWHVGDAAPPRRVLAHGTFVRLDALHPSQVNLRGINRTLDSESYIEKVTIDVSGFGPVLGLEWVS